MACISLCDDRFVTVMNKGRRAGSSLLCLDLGSILHRAICPPSKDPFYAIRNGSRLGAGHLCWWESSTWGFILLRLGLLSFLLVGVAECASEPPFLRGFTLPELLLSGRVLPPHSGHCLRLRLSQAAPEVVHFL